MSSNPNLQICCLLDQSESQTTISTIKQVLTPDCYDVSIVSSFEELSITASKRKYAQDCLVIWGDLEAVKSSLESTGLFLPTIVVTPVVTSTLPSQIAALSVTDSITIMELAIVTLPSPHLQTLPDIIERAIANFLQLSPYSHCNLPTTTPDLEISLSLSMQQQRLSEKLKARLGYLGIYYKRDPKQFIRNLSEVDKQLYTDYLKKIYQSIILEYFKDRPENLNSQIDEFVNLAFLGDVSVSQVLEVHMELMDEFSKQLKLERRSEGVLLDYRITLIDIIAHLCEMYRRSVPRKT